MMTPEDPLAPYRTRLMGLAYRMTGSLADAEDVLQDAYLRYSRIDKETIRSEEAFLVKIVTRLCLDRLKSAQSRREVYAGPWLPEPAPDTSVLSPETATELADDLSFALLLTLERLSGAERAAFLLHDVFDRPYAEIAAALDKSEAACRQLAARARRAVRAERAGRRAEPSQHEELLAQFVTAAASGDPSRLSALLAKDAVVYSDGGGVKPAAYNPIMGADRTARFVVGLANKYARKGSNMRFAPAAINGLPGLLLYLEGEFDQTLSLEVQGGEIVAIYMVRNPEKLRAITAAMAVH